MLIDFRELFPKYNLKFNGVLHVGANVGEEAPVYRELGINNQVWVEANPEIYKILVENLKNSGIGNWTAYNYAAGNENKTTAFHIASNKGQSSSVLDFGTHATAHADVTYIDHIEVEMKRLEDVFNIDPHKDLPQVCDFLNIDVQGFELQVLQGLGRYVDQMKAIYLEVNKEELYLGCALIDSIDLFMTAHRFRRVETLWVGNTGWGDALYIKD